MCFVSWALYWRIFATLILIMVKCLVKVNVVLYFVGVWVNVRGSRFVACCSTYNFTVRTKGFLKCYTPVDGGMRPVVSLALLRHPLTFFDTAGIGDDGTVHDDPVRYIFLKFVASQPKDDFGAGNLTGNDVKDFGAVRQYHAVLFALTPAHSTERIAILYVVVHKHHVRVFLDQFAHPSRVWVSVNQHAFHVVLLDKALNNSIVSRDTIFDDAGRRTYDVVLLHAVVHTHTDVVQVGIAWTGSTQDSGTVHFHVRRTIGFTEV